MNINHISIKVETLIYTDSNLSDIYSLAMNSLKSLNLRPYPACRMA